MRLDEKRLERWACAYFFAAPSLVYGLFTSRLPALKIQASATDAQIGTILLVLGSATLAGLLFCSFIIDRAGSHRLTAYSPFGIMLCISLAAFSTSLWLMGIMCLLAGLFVGLCDVAMNAQGIYIEKRQKIPCLSFLHAISSVGGVAGALLGSLFALLKLSPFVNCVITFAAFLLLWPYCKAKLHPAPLPAAVRAASAWRSIPIFIWICGMTSLVCHIAEGSAGSWGSILLHSVKGASQQEAALVFAAFTGAMVISRLLADNARNRIGDTPLTAGGAILGAFGMALALLSPWPWLCLCGYAMMGFGLGPVVPVLFSRAGDYPGVTPGQASSVVSICSYAGMLVIPPVFGMLGNHWGLANSLWLIVVMCLLTAAGCRFLAKRD